MGLLLRMFNIFKKNVPIKNGKYISPIEEYEQLDKKIIYEYGLCPECKTSFNKKYWSNEMVIELICANGHIWEYNKIFKTRKRVFYDK